MNMPIGSHFAAVTIYPYRNYLFLINNKFTPDTLPNKTDVRGICDIIPKNKIIINIIYNYNIIVKKVLSSSWKYGITKPISHWVPPSHTESHKNPDSTGLFDGRKLKNSVTALFWKFMYFEEFW